MELSFEIYIVVVIVLLLTIAVGIYPNFLEIYDKSNKVVNGKCLVGYIFLVIFLVTFMMFQSGLNDQQIKEKDDKIDSLQKGYAKAYRQQQDSSTQIIQKGIETGNNRNYEALATAFRKQGVKDSVVRAIIENLKDSLKRPNIFNGVRPEADFDFMPGECITTKRTGDEYIFTTAFQSKEAKTENIELSLFPVILSEKNGYQKRNVEEIANGKIKVGKDEILYSDFKIKVPMGDSIKVLFLVAKDSYINTTSRKQHTIYSLRLFDMKQRMVFLIDPHSYPSVHNYLEPR